MSYPEPRRTRLQLVAVEGNPTEDEVAVVTAALEKLASEPRSAQVPSLWLRAGRAQGRRLGMYDYRDRFSAADAWRLSLRFPPGGREFMGLSGRADAR